MYLFVNGMIAMGCLVATCFFLLLRRRTSDALFAFFAAAFFLLAVERFVLSWMDIPEQSTSAVYLIRFMAFVCIILGIVWKNRRARNI
ncbi:MAG TPA: DUF5985 family protein [Candidatus Baltobacteraceae bacterium]|jgi:hypothetical protein|nr:DUF5985 family protein [Candidatus Baltobacteraceae bacterium]